MTFHTKLFAFMAVLLQLWSMGLITYATIAVYSISEHSMALATIYGSTTGILTIVTGYIQKRMSDFLNADKDNTRSSE